MIVHRRKARSASRPPAARRTRPYRGYSAYTSTTAQRIRENSGRKMNPASASVPAINAIYVSLLAFDIVGCSG
jgi:hypothetical protein